MKTQPKSGAPVAGEEQISVGEQIPVEEPQPAATSGLITCICRGSWVWDKHYSAGDEVTFTPEQFAYFTSEMPDGFERKN